MTFGQIRFVKWTLFATLIGCASYVGFFLWEGFRGQAVVGALLVDEPESPTSRQVALEQLDSEGRTAWTLTAAESVGQSDSGQKFRDVEIRFNAGDGETPVTVTADECEVGENSAVRLEGNVVVVDDTTLRLEANTLLFRRFPDRVWSTEPVRYSKKGLEGTAGGMVYIIKRGELDLDDHVAMTLQETGDAPVKVTSRTAHMRRDRHWVQYVDDVRVRQGSRRLNANDLQLFLDESNETLTRVEAFERVDLRMEVVEDSSEEPGGTDDEVDDAAGLGASMTSQPGLKQLLTERLQITFREGGEELELVRALDGGQLVLRLPEDAREGLDKTLSGNLLAFDFNESSELTQVRGRGGVELVLTPRDGTAADRKTVRARQMESDFHPESGDLLEARCTRSVEFEQGDVRASSEEGVFRAADSRLVLTESPRLWDPRASLTADRIELDVDSGDVEGVGDVRSSSVGDGGGAALFPSDGDDAVYFVSNHVSYDRARDLAVYTGAARGFRGPNRVEADTIRIHQAAGDLEARGTVRTVFTQELIEKDSSERGVTMTRAGSLDYVREKKVLRYREDVKMRSQDMTLSGNRVDVTLAAEGNGVEEIDAEGEVEIETPDGQAAGEHAKYCRRTKA